LLIFLNTVDLLLTLNILHIFLLHLSPCLANFSTVAFEHIFLFDLLMLKPYILSKDKMLALLNQTNHLTPSHALSVILVHAYSNPNVLDFSTLYFPESLL
jgi:hypothetical protein